MQRSWKRGRIAAAAAGLAFLGVLVLAGVFRAEIEAWYHLERLKRDPDHFMRIAGEPEGSPERVACERFVAREPGKLALISAVAVQMKRVRVPHWRECYIQGLPIEATHAPFLSSEVCSSDCSHVAELRYILLVEDQEYTTEIHDTYGGAWAVILPWLPSLGPGERVLPEDPLMAYELAPVEGVMAVRVRKLTPPPGARASTPPSPPSTGTSAG